MTEQLSNHFVEGLRKVYELEPFIKLESSLPDMYCKGSKSIKGLFSLFLRSTRPFSLPLHIYRTFAKEASMKERKNITTSIYDILALN